MRFYPLEKLINLHDNYTRQFKIDALQLLLLQRQGEVYLIEASCPHQGHSLEAAAISGGTLVCPLHQYQFALDDGRLLYASRENCRRLRTFSVVYERTEVGVMLEG